MLTLKKDKERLELGASEKVKLVKGSRGILYGLHRNVGEGKSSDTCLVMSAGFDATHGNLTFNRLTKYLENDSLSTYRYDYFGRGLSQGRSNELMYSTSVSDLNLILDDLQKKYHYQKFILLGCSYGGLVSARVAVDRKERGDIGQLVMKCPITDFKKLVQQMFPLDYLERVLGKKQDLVYNMDGEEKRIGWPALTELFNNEVDRLPDLAEQIDVQTDVVVGSCDRLAGLDRLVESVDTIKTKGGKVDCVWVEGADHFFAKERDFDFMVDSLYEKIICKL